MFMDHCGMKRFKVCRWLVMAAIAVVMSGPLAARAETPIAQVTLYEVDEALRFKKAGHDTDAVQARLAQASLLGSARDVCALPITNGECANANGIFRTGAFVKADASSNVNVATLRGPVNGTINLLYDMDKSRNSLDTLVITSVLEIKGELDLTPTASKIPMAPIQGQWRVSRGHQRGSYSGVFLIPFDIGGGNYAYLDPAQFGFKCKVQPNALAAYGLCPVDSTEFVLGIPMTKALLTFSE